MLFLDYDNVDLEDVVVEVKMLQSLYPRLGVAHIYESEHGYHVRFTKARLSEKERNILLDLCAKHVHRGYIYFTELVTGTLRVSKKYGIKRSIKPFYKFSIVNGEKRFLKPVAYANRWVG